MAYDSSERDDSGEPVGEQGTGFDPTPSEDFRGLGTAVGAFLVLGIGFVFTFFFAGQFAGGNGGIGGGAVISSSGLGTAVLLSPLLALFVGVLVGRDNNPSAVRDAGVGSALGFVVMYFVTLVVATSLGGAGTGGGNTVGPLAGYTVGVGLTGAAAAAVTRLDVAVPGGLDDYSVARPVVFGVGAFLAFAVGFTVSVFLADALSSGNSGGLAGFSAVQTLLALGMLFSPIVGVFTGVTIGRNDDAAGETEAAVGGGVAGAVGAALVVVVFYAVLLVVEPGGAPAGEFPLGLLVGMLVGTGLTGAGAAYVGATR